MFDIVFNRLFDAQESLFTLVQMYFVLVKYIGHVCNC